MAENLDIPPLRFNALSLRRLAERKNIERIFGATAAILATNVVKYLAEARRLEAASALANLK
jgi:hypothetical protein